MSCGEGSVVRCPGLRSYLFDARKKGILKQGVEWELTESRKGWRTRDKERQMSCGNSSSSTDVSGESLFKKNASFLQVEDV